MQAITTRYLPPTNTRGARIVVRCQAKRIVVPWAGGENQHLRAAQELARRLGWNYGRWYEGSLPDGTGNCYVLAADGGYSESFTVED